MALIYWLIGTLFYFYQFIFRTVFSTLGNEVADGFQISVADLSIFFSSGMLTYALMQIPGGILLDHYGPRKILTAAMAILSTGIILVGVTDSFPLAILGRVMMGMGSAFGFLGTYKIAAMWFRVSTMSLLLGFTVFLGSLGGAFSNNAYNALPSDWDWRHALIAMGGVGVLFAIGIGLFLRERHSNPAPAENGFSLDGFRAVVRNKQILLAAFFTFFAYIPISILGDSWGPLAFEKIFGASNEVANLTVTYFYVAFALGSLFYSAIASMTNRLREVLIFEFCATFVGLYLLLVRTEIGASTFFDIPGFLILSSLIAFNLGGVALAFPIGCSHAPKEISATVVGIMNMLCMVSGGIFSKLVGDLLNYHWDGATSADGLPLYSGLAYQNALMPLLGTTMLAIILIYFVRDGQKNPEGAKH